MRFRVDGSKALFADVCVALGGGHVAVAEQILYHAKVCATIQQVRREAVPQRVRMGWAAAATVEAAPDIARRQPHTSFVAEQRRTRVTGQDLAANRQPSDQRLDTRRAERHAALLAALAPYGDRCRRQVHGVDIERAEFAHPHAAAVQNFEYRVVAEATPQRLTVIDVALRIKERSDLAVFEHPWQSRRPGRGT